MPPTSRDIIESFGGRHLVATIIGSTPNAITQWYRIGVPAKYHLVLLEYAIAHQIQVSSEDLRTALPCKRMRRRAKAASRSNGRKAA